jgi:ubiquinone/menaquinone biosynthesis C-methylase UbiE
VADGLATRTAAAAFDEAAASYDSDFSGTTIGVWLRDAVWSRVAPFVKPGMRALDLGCGTGEDAVWLARNGCHVTAADGSLAMLERVAAKAKGLSLAHRIRTIALDLNAPAEAQALPGAPFDLVLSNFGAINCVDDLHLLARMVEQWVKPQGVLALVYMGRFCAWESAYYLARFDRRATRRWSGSAKATVGSQVVNVRYWSKGEIARAFAPSFQVLGIHGVGTFLPPSYLFHWVDRRPLLFRALAQWERLTAGLWPFSRMGDHTLVILRRSDTIISARSSR